MKSGLLSSRRGWSPYIYQHDEPLRVFLKRVARASSNNFKEGAQRRWRHVRYCVQNPHEGKKFALAYLRARVLTLSTLLVILWFWVLWKHEIVAFQEAIDACAWEGWEAWPAHAQPHHLVFVADPQLVDPHTYPERPWPLSTLTALEADIYLRRGYSRIQRDLDPDTVYFLGDLFDGGREWSTPTTKSPEEQFRKFGDDFWYKEYRRFGNIFLKEWDTTTDEARRARNQGRRVIASLPGNHDLGFAQGVQLPVRDRFTAMFGEGNRMDIIANHTFISIDSVSLSARDEEDRPDVGDRIWRPTWDFLEKAQDIRSDKIDRHLRTQSGKNSGNYFKRTHGAQDIEGFREDLKILSRPELRTADYPNILLTHVPLYRAPGTPCGPLREKYPPSPPAPGQVESPTFDQRNAITVARGYQYQNVVSHMLTKFIIDSLGGTIGHVFSGDDHDYCEVVHRGYASPGGGIREITVKSLSFTMGVRHPGFLMVSLWNPTDKTGKRADPKAKRTLQTHLCLLPDQLGIFIRYGLLLALSTFLLFIRAFLVVFIPSRFAPPANIVSPLLPTFDKMAAVGGDEKKDVFVGENHHDTANAVTASTNIHGGNNISSRNGATNRAQSNSPLLSYGYGTGPPQERTPSPQSTNGHQKKRVSFTTNTKRGAEDKPRSKPMRLLREWGSSVWGVARVVLVWFLLLQRR